MRFIMLLSSFILLLHGCGNPAGDAKRNNKESRIRYVFRETIAEGDTNMIGFGKFRPLNFTYDLCQQWSLQDEDDGSTPDLTYEPSTNNRLFQEIMMYRDSSVMFNPRNGMKMGKWKLGQNEDKMLLILDFTDGSKREYILLDKTATSLSLAWREDEKRFAMRLSSDGKVHANKLNDPFHPYNNQWRIRPLKEESDTAIRHRLKNCVRFYALYFRDHIKRKRTEINFAGLPSCFLWYRRGIGLYDPGEIPLAWKKCFYSGDQALTGLKMLRHLFNKYDFDWPKGTPNWFYETESVLEQMYHKL